jgi:hypothetical protein
MKKARPNMYNYTNKLVNTGAINRGQPVRYMLERLF